jgi:putative endonuclease
MRGARVRTVKQLAGDAAETIAASFLERRGLSIIARNWRCRGGEIDLVARDGATLVFVDVRMRRSEAFGGARASITSAKQRRILRAARLYLAGQREQPCRCDVVLLDGVDGGVIDWLRDAFGESVPS